MRLIKYSSILLLAVITLFMFPQSMFIETIEADLVDPSALQEHDPIRINGNDHFIFSNGISAGDGSFSNPYLIENWSIDVNNENGIFISDTNSYFIIRNCKFYDSIDDFNTNSGVFLENMQHGTVENIIIKKSGAGIYIKNSYHNIIQNNSILDNEYGVSVTGSDSNFIFNNSVSCNSYGIRLYNSTNNAIFNNTLNQNEWGIYVNHLSNSNKIFNNSVDDNRVGIRIIYHSCENLIKNNKINNSNYVGMEMLAFANDNIILNNIILNNKRHGVTGIIIEDSEHLTLFNNTIINMTYYIEIDGYSIHHYSHNIPVNNTIDKKPIYYWVNQKDKALPLGGGFYGLVGCGNITVNNLTLKNNSPGLLLVNSTDINIENNIIMNNKKGIYLSQSNNIHFNNNTIYENHDGIIGEFSNNIGIFDNIIHNNVDGVKLWYSNNIVIFDNLIYDNIHYGLAGLNGSIIKIINNAVSNNEKGVVVGVSEECSIINNHAFLNGFGLVLDDVWNGNISNNRIFNNTYGLKLYGTNKNSIFNNNYFSNQQNIDTYGDYKAASFWNISKVPGSNIVGGPYFGGNYWSDYEGEDIDGDYIGDTDLPYGLGDYQPLIPAPPFLLDETNYGLITTNDLIFEAMAEFLFGVENVHVEYWSDFGSHYNLTMKRISGNNLAGRYSQVINISDNVQVLHYFISAENFFGIWNVTPTQNLVTDNYKPIIKDLSGIPTTGENFTLKIEYDFIEIIDAEVEYWFDNDMGNGNLITFKNLRALVEIPLNAQTIHYTIRITDVFDNSISLTIEKEIVDNDSPQIEDLNGVPTTGDAFLINANMTDNIGINVSYLEYWLDNGSHTNVSFDGEYEMVLFDVTIILEYIISCSDFEGNTKVIIITLNVQDNDNPIIKDFSNVVVKRDEGFIFNICVEDNIEVKRVYVIYWYNDDKMNISLDSVDSKYIKEVNLPKTKKKFHYIIYTEDNANNKNNSAEKTVKISDYRSHNFEEEDSWKISVIISIILLMVILGVIYYRRGKMPKEEENKPVKRIGSSEE